MYTQPQKKFRPRDEEYIIEELQKAATLGPRFEKVFLADGDAMTLSIRRLTRILELIKEYLPWVKRVGAYCLPRNVSKKSVDDLIKLRELGLEIGRASCRERV